METVAAGDQRKLRFIWGEMRFFIGCLRLDAICGCIAALRRRLAARYRKFVTEPKQEEKVNMGVYLHAC